MEQALRRAEKQEQAAGLERRLRAGIPPLLGAFGKTGEPARPRRNERQSRSEYKDNIEKYFPKLFKIINYRRLEEASERPGDEGSAPEKPRWTGIVYWDTADKTLDRFKKWEKNMPSTLDVMVAQEDLWVYEALLRIIKNTNERAKDHKHANIKRIAALEIGDEAVQSWRKTDQTVLRLGDAAAAAVGPAPAAAPAGMPGARAPKLRRWPTAMSTTRAGRCRIPPSSPMPSSA